MARKIPLRELELAIEKELKEYSAEAAAEIKDDIKAVAKSTTKMLRRTSPKKSGDYAKGWSYRVEYEGRTDIRMRIYNHRKPQITHVVEFGHAKRNGGRVQEHPHIRPAIEQAEKDLDGKVKVTVKG